MLKFKVNAKRCQRCGLCATFCASRIIVQEGNNIPFIPEDRQELCMQCQHCLAICPHGAISIFGRNPDKSTPFSAEAMPVAKQMHNLLRGRRSIRKYKQRNVPAPLLRKIMATLANCPTGTNRRELNFILIDDLKVMEQFKAKTKRAIAKALKSGRIKDNAHGLESTYNAWQSGKADPIFRTAPHALIVSAPPDAPCATQDVALALAYFELLAQCSGLGTVWWGRLRWLLETLPELKQLLKLPADHQYYAMLFGLPDVQYSRGVQRDDAACVRKVSL